MRRLWARLTQLRTAILLVLTLVIGAALRLSYPDDIEYKYDERYMFEALEASRDGAPLPALGMRSGVEIRNPGMSVWVFVALGELSRAGSPVELARAVQILNIVALAGFAAFALLVAPGERRRQWMWGLALVSVNPLAVLLARKIWAQSLLPFFALFFWLGWWRRDRAWGSALWGLVGTALGQIHMSGFFMAGGVWAYTVYAGRRGHLATPVRWGWWAAGSGLAALGLIPWLRYLAGSWDTAVRSAAPSWGFERLSFWRYWITDPLGFDLSYSLGISGLAEFVSGPRVGGTETHLLLLPHLVLGAAGVVAVGGILHRVWRSRAADPRAHARHVAEAHLGALGLVERALLIGFGVALALSGVPIHRHYLLVTFPFESVWLARLLSWRWLVAVWVCLLVVTVGYLSFIHANHGYAGGDYGVGYRWQQAGPSTP